MRFRAGFASFGVALSWCAAGLAQQTPAAPVDARQQVERFADSLEAALKQRDKAALESIIADDFEFVHSTGRIEDRASFVARAAAGELASQRTPGEQLEVRLRVFDRTAIRTTLTSVRFPQSEPSAPPTRIWTRSVYARSDGGWRWLSAQSTTVAVRPAQ